jgi:hypothetical protein
MNTDVEELLRDGMERFTAGVRAPAGLAAEAGRLRRRRRAARTAVACGIAAVTAAAVVLAVVPGAAARPGGSAAQARLTGYVTKRVENALASENLVFVGRSSSRTWGNTVTWAYRSRNRFEEFTSSSCGHMLANGSCTGHGGSEPGLAQGTALVGGKLVWAYVTYFNRRYSLSPLGSQPASACSMGMSMAAPIIPTTHWSAFIDATLACGAASVTGHLRVNGVQATRITGKPITVRLQPGYAKVVHEKWATARWTLYVNPTTYLPVRMYGSTETFGGSGGSYTSSFVTNVRWLPPTQANTAEALVTIPPGFHRFYGPAGDQ